MAVKRPKVFVSKVLPWLKFEVFETMVAKDFEGVCVIGS